MAKDGLRRGSQIAHQPSLAGKTRCSALQGSGYSPERSYQRKRAESQEKLLGRITMGSITWHEAALCLLETQEAQTLGSSLLGMRWL